MARFFYYFFGAPFIAVCPDRVHPADPGGRGEDEGLTLHLRGGCGRSAMRLQVRLPEAHEGPAGTGVTAVCSDERTLADPFVLLPGRV